MYSYIIVKTSFRGFHQYKDAPEPVAFLRSLHRHDFLVEAKIEVKHDDRELEFFIEQSALDVTIAHAINEEDVGSCEMAARAIVTEMLNDSKYHGRLIEVSVSEDGENRAIVGLTEEDLVLQHGLVDA